MDVTKLTLLAARDAVAQKKVSSTELTKAYLDRVSKYDATLHACNEVYAERALQRAKMVDDGRVTGALAGVPIMIKDNMCTTFGRTTCSSKILENFRAPYDATVVKKLEAAGAVILAKTNLDEFAMGSSTENSAFGATRNPWDPARVPGGSSGGSAAALAADFCAASLGSDTGGSIRQPASLCGIVGLKPTYGLVSRYGLVAFASSLDQIGPFTRDVADCAALMNVIAGFDPMDSTSADESISGKIPDYLASLEQPVKGLRLGVAKQYMSDANEPAMQKAVNEAIDRYRQMGATVVEVDLPHTEYGIPTYYIVATAEASSNLARYDGVHYGHRTKNPADLMDVYAASRAEGFGDEVKRRIMLGTYALSSGYYDAYYNRALKVRRLIKQDFDRAFEVCDAIICPTTTGAAFKFGEKTDDPLQMYLNDVYTVNCNLAGIAGISIPCGFDVRDGKRLPLGVQLLGPTFSEANLLRIARMYERTHAEATARPVIAA
jgi:aspartyl-tRNA(Asn)/glutamyl-tRNA(Gln) amidotransferase subunit A